MKFDFFFGASVTNGSVSRLPFSTSSYPSKSLSWSLVACITLKTPGCQILGGRLYSTGIHCNALFGHCLPYILIKRPKHNNRSLIYDAFLLIFFTMWSSLNITQLPLQKSITKTSSLSDSRLFSPHVSVPRGNPLYDRVIQWEALIFFVNVFIPKDRV